MFWAILSILSCLKSSFLFVCLKFGHGTLTWVLNERFLTLRRALPHSWFLCSGVLWQPFLLSALESLNPNANA